MAGTLFGLGLSQQTDATGTPLAGCLLYIYQENSSTPVTTYADFSLSTSQTFPIEADSAGRLPQIWVDDGSYRARLTTSDGIEVFDESSVTAIGASSTTAGSGGGGSSVDATAIFETGDTKWRPIIGSLTGWVRANGRTIGSGSSGATERANSDCQSLFEYLWNNYTDTLCAVGGGRGATATADFNANKVIATYTMRGKGMFGLDDMGNSAAGIIAAGTPTAISFGGAEAVTIAQANLPNVSFLSTALTATVTDPGHLHSVHNVGQEGTNVNPTGGSGKFYASNSNINSETAVTGITVSVSGSVPSGGSGTAVTTTSPYMLGTVYIKL